MIGAARSFMKNGPNHLMNRSKVAIVTVGPVSVIVFSSLSHKNSSRAFNFFSSSGFRSNKRVANLTNSAHLTDSSKSYLKCMLILQSCCKYWTTSLGAYRLPEIKYLRAYQPRSVSSRIRVRPHLQWHNRRALRWFWKQSPRRTVAFCSPRASNARSSSAEQVSSFQGWSGVCSKSTRC